MNEHSEEIINKLQELVLNTTLTNEEIARELNFSEGYIKNLISRYDLKYQYMMKWKFTRSFMINVVQGRFLLGFKTKEEATKFLFSASEKQLKERRGGKSFTINDNEDALVIKNNKNYSLEHGFNFHSPIMQESFKNMYKNPEQTMKVVDKFIDLEIKQQKLGAFR